MSGEILAIPLLVDRGPWVQNELQQICGLKRLPKLQRNPKDVLSWTWCSHMTLESRYQPRAQRYNTLARVSGEPEVFDFARGFFRLGFDDPETTLSATEPTEAFAERGWGTWMHT